jgi:hypothetical protein
MLAYINGPCLMQYAPVYNPDQRYLHRIAIYSTMIHAPGRDHQCVANSKNEQLPLGRHIYITSF